MRGALHRFALACLPAMFVLFLFTIALPLRAGTNSTAPAATNPSAAAAAAADTNFMDPSITDDGASTKMLNDVLKKNGIKTDSMLDEHFLFASVIWGGVAGGYLFYGKKQREMIPFIGGLVMMAASFMITSWFWMSLASIAIMVGVYSLMKRGY